MRTSLFAAVMSLCLVGICSADNARAAVRKETNIPAEPLGAALQTLARSYDFQVLYRSEIVKDLQSPGAVGSLTSDEALIRVLSGTGLSYKYLDESTVTIVPIDSLSPSGATNADEAAAGKEVGKKSSQGFRMAQVGQGATPQPVAMTPAEDSAQLQEVVVTAQKRSENLLDVPVPVTAINAQKLLDSNQVRLQDYYSSVPGLNLAPALVSGAPSLAIRGVTTGGYTNPTVGIVVDDVPFGSSTSIGGGTDAPDFDPGDLARVEVLRGPQGTLYGADSMGGLLKFVTADPSTDAFTARVSATTTNVHNGSELGYSFRGSANIPLSDEIAMRASVFTRTDPGYIDNVETGRRGVNKTDVEGAHLAALWRPSAAFSLKLSALYQQSTASASSQAYVESGLGDLQQSAPLGVGGYTKKMQAYSAIATATLGDMTLVSLTGYNVTSLADSMDFTQFLSQLSQQFFGVPGTSLLNNSRTNKFTEELRLSGTIGERADWLVGAFYTHESNQFVAREYAVASDGAVAGTWMSSDNYPTTYEEYAGFGDLTLHLTNRLDLQIGGRESQNQQAYTETIIGPQDSISVLYPGLTVPIVNPSVQTKDNSFTYLVTPKLQFTPDLMVYVRLASGYRAGGPNPTSTIYNLPPSFKPDRTENYEVGVKGQAFNRTLSFDISAYYIDWKNIQLFLLQPVSGAGYYANASRARSQGLEVSVEARPWAGFTWSAWADWNDAELTEGFGPASVAYGVAGDRLPNSSRFSGNVSIQQEFPLGRQLTGFVGAAINYVGERVGVFTSAPPAIPPRQEFPGYAKVDAHAGINYGPWSFNLFANNLTDRRGVVGGGLGTYQPIGRIYIQPRTVGVGVTRQF